MKKLVGVLAMAMVLALAGAAMADGLPAAKAAARVADIHILNATADMVWTDILTMQIKTNSQADLFINPSLECGLYTRTKSAGSTTSVASSRIRVRVLVDNAPIANYPANGIVYSWRSQTLTTQLGQVMVGTTLQDEFVELILETMEANAFNFVVENVGVGVHMVKVQAAIDISDSGDSTAKATIGFGAVTMEEVRLVQDSQTDTPVFQ
jgi:hypothetical protein